MHTSLAPCPCLCRARTRTRNQVKSFHPIAEFNITSGMEETSVVGGKEVASTHRRDLMTLLANSETGR